MKRAKLTLTVLVTALVAVNVALSFWLAAQLSVAQSELQSMKWTLESRMGQLSAEVAAVMDERLAREDEIVADYSFEMPAIDARTRVASVPFSVLLKSVPSNAAVTFSNGDGTQSVAATAQGGRYQAALPFDLFEPFVLSVAVTDSQGTTQHQRLQIDQTLSDSLLPQLYVFDDNASQSYTRSSVNAKEDKLMVRSGTLRFDFYSSKSDARFETGFVKTLLNGKELERQQLQPSDNGSFSNASYQFKGKMDNGDTLEVLVVATDSFGFAHEIVVAKEAVDAEGNLDGGYFSGDVQRILDAAGVVVFEAPKN